MLEFKAQGSFRNPMPHKYPGCAMIVVYSDRRYERDNTLHLMNQQVKIDGMTYLVRAIESFAIGVIREGMEIGLLVEPVKG